MKNAIDQHDQKFVVILASLGGIIGGFCCLTPIVLVLFGLASVSAAASLGNVLYGDYRWAFRLLALISLAGGLVIYFRRQGVCTLEEAKRRRNWLLNVSLLALIGSIGVYVFWTYVGLHYWGIAAGLPWAQYDESWAIPASAVLLGLAFFSYLFLRSKKLKGTGVSPKLQARHESAAIPQNLELEKLRNFSRWNGELNDGSTEGKITMTKSELISSRRFSKPNRLNWPRCCTTVMKSLLRKARMSLMKWDAPRSASSPLQDWIGNPTCCATYEPHCAGLMMALSVSAYTARKKSAEGASRRYLGLLSVSAARKLPIVAKRKPSRRWRDCWSRLPERFPSEHALKLSTSSSNKENMAQIKTVAESDAPAKVKVIYEEIKKTLGLPIVPNLFKAMANNPEYLEATWSQFKSVMGPGELTRREKELVALAVSATNNCKYCIYAHTAAVKGLGLSDKGVLELMAVVGLFNHFNKFLDGLLIEPDVGV